MFRIVHTSTGGSEYHIWVLFDNCPNEYEAMCLRHCKAESMTFLHYKGIGNALTFEQQILILEQQHFSDNIMFAEDDYFYLRDLSDYPLNVSVV